MMASLNHIQLSCEEERERERRVCVSACTCTLSVREKERMYIRDRDRGYILYRTCTTYSHTVISGKEESDLYTYAYTDHVCIVHVLFISSILTVISGRCFMSSVMKRRNNY